MTNNIVIQDGAVDLRRRTVERRGGAASLTSKEAGLLEYLAKRTGETVPRSELLEEVWGYNRRISTRTIDNTVRRLRSKIEIDPATPAHIVTVHGEGYRFETAEPAPPTQRRPFPVDPSSFIGRDDELHELTNFFSSGRRIVTIRGPGGQGKTRLARAFATARLASTSAAEALFVDLTACRSRTDMLLATATVLGSQADPDASADQLETQLQAVVRNAGPLLVVFDNFEQIVEEAADAVTALVSYAPELLALTTSRESLRVQGEKVLSLGPLSPADAKQLFLDRNADTSRDDAAPSHDAINRLVERLDHHPLAVELAAARAGEFTVAELYNKLDERFELLRHGRRDAPKRHQTLWATIDWSWAMLSEEGRGAFAQCSVFAGTFDLAAASHVIELPSSGAAVDAHLWELQQKSLIASRSVDGGGRRFFLPVSIRDYAAAKLDESDPARRAHLRAGRYYCGLVEIEAAKLPLSSGPNAVGRLNLELDNVLNIQRKVAQEDPQLAARLGIAIHTLLSEWAPWDLQLATLDLTVRAARQSNPALLIESLLLRARTYRSLGRRGDVEQDLNDLSSADATDVDPHLALRIDHLRGVLLCDGVEHEQGRDLLHQVVEQFAQIGETSVLAEVLMGLGRYEQQFGTLERRKQALPLLMRALDIFQRLDHRRGEAMVREVIGWAFIKEADFEQAQNHLLASIAIHHERAEHRHEVQAIQSLGHLKLEEGSLPEARELMEQTLKLHESIGAPGVVVHPHGSLGLVALEEGNLDLARELFQRCGRELLAIDDLRRYGGILACSAAIEALDGHADEAAELLMESRAQLEAHAGGWGIDILAVFELLADCCRPAKTPAHGLKRKQKALEFIEQEKSRRSTSLLHRAAVRILARYIDGQSSSG